MIFNIITASPINAPFITNAIFAAVKGSTNLLSYAALFEKSELELRALFTEMLLENIEGQELWLSGFAIAQDSLGNSAATCCAWVEGEIGASALLTAQLLSFGIEKDIYQKLISKQDVIQSLRMERQEGALQIEHVYTDPQYRGNKLAAKVIQHQINTYKKLVPQLQKAQIILFKENNSALAAYSNMGFTIAKEIHSAHPNVLQYFPGSTRVLMECEI